MSGLGFARLLGGLSQFHPSAPDPGATPNAEHREATVVPAVRSRYPAGSPPKPGARNAGNHETADAAGRTCGTHGLGAPGGDAQPRCRKAGWRVPRPCHVSPLTSTGRNTGKNSRSRQLSRLEVIVRYIALAGATGAVGLRVGISNVLSTRPAYPPVSGPSTADRPSEFRRRVARGRCPGNGRLRPARLLCRQGRRGCDWPRTGTRTPLQGHPSG